MCPLKKDHVLSQKWMTTYTCTLAGSMNARSWMTISLRTLSAYLIHINSHATIGGSGGIGMDRSNFSYLELANIFD